MKVFDILWIAGMGVAFVASVVSLIGKHKTEWCDWGEPVVTIFKIVGLAIAITGLILEAVVT